MEDNEPYVVNRDGKREPVRFDRVTDRVRDMASAAYHGGPLRNIQILPLVLAVSSQIRSGMLTSELDRLLVNECAARSSEHSDYSQLAARLLVSDLHKRVERSCGGTMAGVTRRLARGPRSRLSPGYVQLVERYAAQIENLVHLEDYNNTGFAVETLLRAVWCRR